MKHSRILILINSTGIGGAERQVVQDANLLSEEGYEVTVCYGREGPLKEQFLPEIKLINLNTDSVMLAGVKLFSYLKEHKQDLIISHLFWANKSAAFAKIVSGSKRLIQFEHGLGTWRKWYHILLARISAFPAEAVITCSQASKKLRIERDKIPENKLEVVYNSYAESDRYSESNPVIIKNNDKRFRIAYAGRFNKVKQLDILIKIADIVKKETGDFCFILMGDGDQRNMIEKLIKDHSLEENFILTGYVRNPFDYLLTADCFILPSKREDFSLSLLEASYAGLPCLAFDVGGNSEIIDDGDSGFLVRPFEVKEMVSRIIILLRNRELCKEMGKRAKQKVQSRFSEEMRLKKLKKLIYAKLEVI